MLLDQKAIIGAVAVIVGEETAARKALESTVLRLQERVDEYGNVVRVPGPQGERGLPGDPGAPGERGLDGAAGERGADGAPGPQGERGEQGERGADGTPGRDGAPGERGADGLAGMRGANGLPGADGAPGRDGAPGPAGRDGMPGERGERGTGGPPGDAGPMGPPGPAAYAGRARGLYDPNANDYRAMDVVAQNGSEWRATKDDPGPLPGPGWALGAKGARGKPGERGPAGPPGPRPCGTARRRRRAGRDDDRRQRRVVRPLAIVRTLSPRGCRMSAIVGSGLDRAALPTAMLALAKSHLRVDGTYDDPYITDALGRAISWFERVTNISVNKVTWAWSPDARDFFDGAAAVPVSPINSFTVGDAATPPADLSADYRLITMLDARHRALCAGRRVRRRHDRDDAIRLCRSGRARSRHHRCGAALHRAPL